MPRQSNCALKERWATLKTSMPCLTVRTREVLSARIRSPVNHEGRPGEHRTCGLASGIVEMLLKFNPHLTVDDFDWMLPLRNVVSGSLRCALFPLKGNTVHSSAEVIKAYESGLIPDLVTIPIPVLRERMLPLFPKYIAARADNLELIKDHVDFYKEFFSKSTSIHYWGTLGR